MTLGSLPPDRTPSPGGVVRGHAQQQQQLSLQQYIWIIAVAVVFVLLVHLLGEILTPFLIGAILAYIGNPAVSWGERHRVPRTVGTLVILAITILAVLGLIRRRPAGLATTIAATRSPDPSSSRATTGLRTAAVMTREATTRS